MLEQNDYEYADEKEFIEHPIQAVVLLIIAGTLYSCLLVGDFFKKILHLKS